MFQEAGPERPTFIDERPRFAGRHWLTSVARQPMMTPQTYVATKPLNGASCWPPEHRPKNKLIEIFTAHLPPPPALLSSLSLLSSVYSYLEDQLVCPPHGVRNIATSVSVYACLSICMSVGLHLKTACPYFAKFSVHVNCSRGWLGFPVTTVQPVLWTMSRFHSCGTENETLRIKNSSNFFQSTTSQAENVCVQARTNTRTDGRTTRKHNATGRVCGMVGGIKTRNHESLTILHFMAYE